MGLWTGRLRHTVGTDGKPDILFTVLCYYIPLSIFNHIRKNG